MLKICVARHTVQHLCNTVCSIVRAFRPSHMTRKLKEVMPTASCLQRAPAAGHVVQHLLGPPAVRHKADAVDGDAGLSDIGGDDGLAVALGRGVKHLRGRAAH